MLRLLRVMLRLLADGPRRRTVKNLNNMKRKINATRRTMYLTRTTVKEEL